MYDIDVTKRFGAELRKATHQLVNEHMPSPVLQCLAELQAAEHQDIRRAQALSTPRRSGRDDNPKEEFLRLSSGE